MWHELTGETGRWLVWENKTVFWYNQLSEVEQLVSFPGPDHLRLNWPLWSTNFGDLVLSNGPILSKCTVKTKVYSCLENPMDEGAWWAAVHGVAKSQTRLSDFTLTFHFPALEKEMATHSSVLAWRIPGTGEPHGLTSMGSHRVGHDWSDLATAAVHLVVTLSSVWKWKC